VICVASLFRQVSATIDHNENRDLNFGAILAQLKEMIPSKPEYVLTATSPSRVQPTGF